MNYGEHIRDITMKTKLTVNRLTELESERVKYLTEAMKTEVGSADEYFYLYHIAAIDLLILQHSNNVTSKRI